MQCNQAFHLYRYIPKIWSDRTSVRSTSPTRATTSTTQPMIQPWTTQQTRYLWYGLGKSCTCWPCACVYLLCRVRDCVLFKFLFNETFIIWSTYSFWKLALFSENRFTVSLQHTARTRPILGLHISKPKYRCSNLPPDIGRLVVLFRPR